MQFKMLKSYQAKLFLSLLVSFFVTQSFSQKKELDHPDYDIWNTIENPVISGNAEFVMYSLQQGEKDQFLKIKTKKAKMIFEHDRSENGQFTNDSHFAIFSIKAWKDSIIELKRKKIKEDEMPRDSLGIFNLKTNNLEKLAHITSYKLPEKWSGYLAYTIDPAEAETKSEAESKTKAKTKKPGKKTGYPLIVRHLETSTEDTIHFVNNYVFAKEAKSIMYTTTGDKDGEGAGVYIRDLETKTSQQVYSSHPKTDYPKVSISNSGQRLAFVADADTTKAQVRPNELYLWESPMETAKSVLDSTTTPTGYRVSADENLDFSDDESKLYFGLALPPIVKDTTLIEEEIVNVEVWTYDEPRLYTVQEMQLDKDKKQSFKTVYHLEEGKVIQIASESYPDATLAKDGNATYAVISNDEPYFLESQWTGKRAFDMAIIDIESGELKGEYEQFLGNVRISPGGNYAYGYQPQDSTWFALNLNTLSYQELTKDKVYYDELNDKPDLPSPYGVAGWTKNDNSLIVYDRFDLWEIDPETGKSKALTNGRASQTKYRYIQLDEDEDEIDPKTTWLLSHFNEKTKRSGYTSFDYVSQDVKIFLEGPYHFSTPKKAKEKDAVIFTRESFEEFPNIRYSELNFKKPRQISDANPQQKDYNWGSAELVHWTSLDGIELTGVLIKPEDFDPTKTYPMLVNFYERSSDRLHRHRAPKAERSTINYSLYASRGYLIFNPDVVYRIGYPGESVYNSVLPGVTSLIEKGFVDKNRIGVQGHSWGGYQIADLITKTDIFKAAEAGAPVVNMLSAYGGIRWWTGLSRQFQYEHTQSRIGGTPWEYPQRYVENSPLFNLDKINTPILIMHNDADGHVPWYQGIEFFTGLRRLGKSAWLLNYNDEPHWPLKIQNRKDFSIRMAQFFDYYLKDAPQPQWMKSGVPAIEKGINQGYELLEE
jgi:dipeptidyl aminopeptidase/acylaminoacyl peptidase